jgi:hypothetical protein
MRHIGEKEYAIIAAPWASSALLAVFPSTRPSVGIERSDLQLPRASEQLLGPRSGRNCLGCGCGRPTRQPSSNGSSCAPPMPPSAGFFATTSVVVMIAHVCAVSGGQAASFATGIDLQRDHATALSEVCERGSAEAMREGQVCQEGVVKVAVPSSELRRAMGRRLTGADDGNNHPQAPRSLSRPPG